MQRERSPKAMIKSLLSLQRLGILGTSSETGPYASLVVFAATRDMRHLVFATPRATRKYGNLKRDARVSLLVDSRSNRKADFHLAMAATAVGTATETMGAEKRQGLRMFLRKHPDLVDFAASPNCTLFRIRVRTYYVVNRFQETMELHLRSVRRNALPGPLRQAGPLS